MALPDVLARIASVAGEPAALAIARAVGGTRIYIPPAPSAEHWLSQLVGHGAALAIGKEFTAEITGVRVDIPLGPTGALAGKRAEVAELAGAGASERDIVRATGYSGRHIRRLSRGIKPRDPRQGDFFA